MARKALPANIVEVHDLHFSYGDLEIFRGLSLEIPRGKVTAILGGSGSGKSTLLKLIGGQLRPSRGSVKVEGKNVHKLDTDALYKLRLKGEAHAFGGTLIHTLQKAVETDSYQTFKRYSEAVRKQPPVALRDLLDFRMDHVKPVPIEEVESITEIRKRLLAPGIAQGIDKRRFGIEFTGHTQMAHQFVGIDHMHVQIL